MTSACATLLVSAPKKTLIRRHGVRTLINCNNHLARLDVVGVILKTRDAGSHGQKSWRYSLNKESECMLMTSSCTLQVKVRSWCKQTKDVFSGLS